MSAKAKTSLRQQAAARALLAEIHSELRARLKRIDASLAELRERERALNERACQARVREETLQWLRSHPGEAEAIAELFTGT